MMNAVDLEGLDRSQQFQKLSDALGSGELTNTQAVELSREVGLPEDRQRALANSKFVVVGYAEPGDSGLAQQMGIPVSSASLFRDHGGLELQLGLDRLGREDYPGAIKELTRVLENKVTTASNSKHAFGLTLLAGFCTT